MKLMFGYGEADLTPDWSAPLVGFYREDNYSKGVLAPLLAQVSVWGEESRAALITIDSIGFTKELSNDLRDQVAERIGASRENVMLCFSHTHAAPDGDAGDGYFELVCERVMTALETALEGMEEVQTGCVNARAKIGVNRRSASDLVDDRVGILEVRGLRKGEADELQSMTRKLLLLRVTAHGNVLKADNLMISPDYFGNVRETLQKKYGCPVMLIQGAAGNVAPKYFCSKNTPVDARGPRFVRSENALQLMADEVLRSVEEALRDRGTITASGMQASDMQASDMQASGTSAGNENADGGASLQAYSRWIALRAQVPSAERADMIAKEAMAECGIDGTEWLAEVKRLRAQGITVQEEQAEVQYFKIGAFCLCGMAYELMTEFALEAAERLKDEFFYLNGYANGCLSYFPTKEEFDLGGYEVYWSLLSYYKYFGRVYPFEREEADRVVEFAVDNART
ncbi:MAG: alkaline ceramidase [Lachnospiraceae bacterium]|nr:alkaline ceramidase [Lachnospiraceae bacterium]